MKKLLILVIRSLCFIFMIPPGKELKDQRRIETVETGRIYLPELQDHRRTGKG
jgi:hypothetical protein